MLCKSEICLRRGVVWRLGQTVTHSTPIWGLNNGSQLTHVNVIKYTPFFSAMGLRTARNISLADQATIKQKIIFQPTQLKKHNA